MGGSGAGKAGRLEEVYGIVRMAVEARRPISAVYDGQPRLFCPHRLGRNKGGQLRALCYQFGGAVWSRLDRRRTGVVLRWTSSVMWNCGKVHGKQLQTTHARRPVSWMPMSMLKTIRTGIRSRDNKEAGGAGSERSPFAVLRWSAGYAARGVRDEPLGRNPSGGMAARNPICRMWAEGEKRLLSETRKP